MFIFFRCTSSEYDGRVEFTMDVPTLEFSKDCDLEDLADNLDIKMNSSSEQLDTICSLIDGSFECMTVEYDLESSTIKFIAESDFHKLDVLI